MNQPAPGPPPARPGEELAPSLTRLFKLVRLHQANSPFIADSLREFRRSLEELWAEQPFIRLCVAQGRLFLNDARLIFSQSQWAAISELTGFLQNRGLYGLAFNRRADLGDQQIVEALNLLNRSQKQEDSRGWLKTELETRGQDWLEILTEEPRPAGGTSEAPTEALGRQTYSQALAVTINVMKTVSSNRRPSLNKAKRAVQNIVELLTENEGLVLGMSSIRAYDDYTYTHSLNVALLSMALAQRLGLSRPDIEHLGMCGLFHDLGKLEVPLELIQKPGNFTDDEFALVQNHVMGGINRIIRLKSSPSLKARLLLPPFEHHLGLNLSGYPQSGRREPISLFGRILAIADHYDAMTSHRIYRKKPISPDRALRLMQEKAGSVLDPIILKVFIGLVGVYPVGTLVVLDSREVGLAVVTPEGAPEGRPIVRLLIPEMNGTEASVRKGEEINLAETDPVSGRFKRNIVSSCHPSEYGLQSADFLL